MTLSQRDSNVAVPAGSIRYTLSSIPGGTHIACDWRRVYRNTFDGVLAGLFMRLAGPGVLRWQLARGLAQAAEIQARV